MKRKAFTLIELLVVIAIIALLLSIVLPALKKVKDTATMTICLSNQKQIGIAVQNYISDHDELLPRSITDFRNEHSNDAYNGSWICNAMRNTTGGSTSDYFISGTVIGATLEQKLNGIRNGYSHRSRIFDGVLSLNRP